MSSFFLCKYLLHFNLCNFLNITSQLTSSLRGMTSWGLLSFVKANKNFQNLQTLLIAVPPRFLLKTQPITSETQPITWPTGCTQHDGLTSCGSPNVFPLETSSLSLGITLYPQPTSGFPSPRRAPAMHFTRYPYLRDREKIILK